VDRAVIIVILAARRAGVSDDRSSVLSIDFRVYVAATRGRLGSGAGRIGSRRTDADAAVRLYYARRMAGPIPRVGGPSLLRPVLRGHERRDVALCGWVGAPNAIARPPHRDVEGSR